MKRMVVLSTFFCLAVVPLSFSEEYLTKKGDTLKSLSLLLGVDPILLSIANECPYDTYDHLPINTRITYVSVQDLEDAEVAVKEKSSDELAGDRQAEVFLAAIREDTSQVVLYLPEPVQVKTSGIYFKKLLVWAETGRKLRALKKEEPEEEDDDAKIEK